MAIDNPALDGSLRTFTDVMNPVAHLCMSKDLSFGS
jgi:hypothetical protein